MPYKKKEQPLLQDVDPKKVFEYELVETHDIYQPREKNNPNVRITNGYPPVFGIPNQGIAFDDETGKSRAWRLIVGQPSIWVDEQDGLKERKEEEINRMLSDRANQLEFYRGKLLVRGVEELKRKALEVQDIFAGKENQYNPKNRVYRLNNPDVAISDAYNTSELKFKALTLAHGASEEEMLAVAFGLGISIDNQSDIGMKNIKVQFVNAAENNPSFFIKHFENPINKIKFTISQGLSSGFISSSQIKNQLTLAESQTPILQIASDGDVVQEVTNMILDKDKRALELYDTLQRMLAD